MRVWKAELVTSNTSDAAPGTITAITQAGAIVATAEGAIQLIELQLPGKKALPVAAIAHAYKALQVGAQFG